MLLYFLRRNRVWIRMGEEMGRISEETREKKLYSEYIFVQTKSISIKGKKLKKKRFIFQDLDKSSGSV